uniref:probable pectinesterase/pectinesterase inhibitor 17 n=1 Tax=Erigeron canadensis TaxID=72917 RepID=UPI001CB92118|nr:probable pectinesterase/pectinesterase inhibitor 17 [Erigeron canadensis]
MAIMKLAHFISIIFFWSSATTTATTNGGINWWCAQTPHYQTCLHHVAEPNPSSAIISINQFLDMTVQAAIDEAKVVLKQTQRIETTIPNDPEKSLWASCVDYFDETMFTLNMVLDHSTLHQPTPLDVQTWISSGLTYIDTCEEGFELININNTMLIPSITTNLTHLLLNSLAISVVIRGNDSIPGAVDWNFSNVHKVSGLVLDKPDVVVAQDGSGDFKTIHGAVNSARMNRRSGATNKKYYLIYVKAGVYQEYVMIPKTIPYIKMFGDGIGKTIVTGDRHLGGRMPTARHLKQSATFRK